MPDGDRNLIVRSTVDMNIAKAADEEGGPRLTLLTAPERSEAWPTDLLPPADPGPSADSSAEPGSAPAPGDGEAGDGEAGDGGAMPFDGVALPAQIPDRFALGPITVFLGELAVDSARVRYVDPAADLVLAADIERIRASPAGGGLDLTLDAGGIRATMRALDESLTDVHLSAALRGSMITIEPLRARWRGEAIAIS